MDKTTVSYAARELGISRQLVHIYIKKGLIRAERSAEGKTMPLILENADVKALLGSEKLKIAHAQRALLLGKKKTRKAANSVAGAAGTATVVTEGPLVGAADVVAGAAEGTAGAATLSGAATV